MNDSSPGEIVAAATADAEVREILRSLEAQPASIAPKYFYDRLGSALFSAICETPEYYPTRTEAGILPVAAEAIRERIGRGVTLVDLGAGDCRKADAIMPVLDCARYVAIDISIGFVRDAVAAIGPRHPGVTMTALGRDLARDWTLERDEAPGPRLLFYPGSSIGNFTPERAIAFLRRARSNAGDDGKLLIGVDLVKDRQVLEAAYDDRLGVTAAFNRNVLNHLNRIAGTDFDPLGWRHVALFNEELSRIEMHLAACGEQRVSWPGGRRRFGDGERIHTENSYKYTPARFAAILAEAGWRVSDRWFDENRWFAMFLAEAA
ncbi:MAG: L-histidine N(alpha)-methyltransferase [Burkholderiaceae bacterium]